jgi:hypothetical protein
LVSSRGNSALVELVTESSLLVLLVGAEVKNNSTLLRCVSRGIRVEVARGVGWRRVRSFGREGGREEKESQSMIQ